MTETEFRFRHSELIESYQYVEMRLKGIVSALLCGEEQSWFKLLDDCDNDPLGILISKLTEIRKNETYFSKDDIEKLRRLKDRRNYWCHKCFTAIGIRASFASKTRELKQSSLGKTLIDDLRKAKECEEKLTETFRRISKEVKLVDNLF